MSEYMVTRIGRETRRTRLSRDAASQLRSVLRHATAGTVSNAMMLDRTCIGITSEHNNGELIEIYDLSARPASK